MSASFLSLLPLVLCHSHLAGGEEMIPMPAGVLQGGSLLSLFYNPKNNFEKHASCLMQPASAHITSLRTRIISDSRLEYIHALKMTSMMII